MKVHTLEKKYLICANIGAVWSFFSSPRNLNKITLPEISFRIVEIAGSAEIHKGQLIRYEVSPFPLLRLNLLAEIIDLDQTRFFFSYQQKQWPFAMWYHQLLLTPVSGRVDLTERLCYSLQLGKASNFINAAIIKSRLRQIFDFREKEIQSIFSDGNS